MKASIIAVPPGGGETDHVIDVEIDNLPSEGDYLVFNCIDVHEDKIDEADKVGCQHCYLVRRKWWHSKYDVNRDADLDLLHIEAEVADGRANCPVHERNLEMYRNRGKEPVAFEATAF